MHINDLDQFYTMTMYTLPNNTIMPSMKENISLVVEIRAFQDFYFMPHLLINIHEITNKINSAHHISVPPYDVYPMYRY